MIQMERDGDVLYLRLHRPEKEAIAVDPGAMVELRRLLVENAGDESVRLLVLRAVVTVFVQVMTSLRFPMNRHLMVEMVGALDDAVAALSDFPAPTLALIDGPAYGAGLGSAGARDLRMCSHRSRFCMPPAKLGVALQLGGHATFGASCRAAAGSIHDLHGARSCPELGKGLRFGPGLCRGPSGVV